MRLVSARTKLEGIEVDNMLRKVLVKFIGPVKSTEATVQFFQKWNYWRSIIMHNLDVDIPGIF